MNFKKFISGVSALTIAASAFAGMAVTANAEAAEVDYIGSRNAVETFDSFDFTSDNGAWTKQDPDKNVDNGYTYTKVGNASDYTRTQTVNTPVNYDDLAALLAAYPDATTVEEVEAALESNQKLTESDGAYTVTTTTYNTYEANRISGKVLTTQKRGANSITATYAATNAVSSGVIVFETDIATAGNAYGNAYRSGYVQLNDASGNPVFKVAYPGPGSNGDSGQVTFTSNGTTSNGTTYKVTSEYKNVGYGANRGDHLSIVIDLDNKTVKGTFAYNRTTGNEAKTVNINGAIAEGTTFKGLTISTSSRSSENNLIGLDNTKLVSLPSAVTSFDVTYKAGSATIGSKTVTGLSNIYVGDTATYYVPAYISTTDGKVYSSGISNNNYAKTIDTTSVSGDNAEVSYTEITGRKVQYVEFDGNTSIANVEKASNGAMKSGIGTDFAALTVDKAGTYTVVIGTGRTTEEASSTRKGSWKVNDGTPTELTFSGPNPGSQTFKNVVLNANDVIKISQANSKCALDYVLIEEVDPVDVTIGEHVNRIGSGDVYNGGTVSFTVDPGYYPTVTGGDLSYSNGTYSVVANGDVTINAIRPVSYDDAFQINYTDASEGTNYQYNISSASQYPCDKYIISFVGAMADGHHGDYWVNDDQGLAYGFAYGINTDGVWSGAGERDSAYNPLLTDKVIDGDTANMQKTYTVGDLFTFVITNNSNDTYTVEAYKNGDKWCTRIYKGFVGALSSIGLDGSSYNPAALQQLAIYGVPSTKPQAHILEGEWTDNNAGYEVNGNALTKDGNTVYGYTTTIMTKSGSLYDTLNVYLVKSGDTSKTISQEVETKISGGAVTFGIVVNEALDMTYSSVFCD